MLRRELLSVCQAYAESHGNIFNYSKTLCMTFKAECKKHSHPITDTWVVKVENMLTKTNIWELHWRLSSQMTKLARKTNEWTSWWGFCCTEHIENQKPRVHKQQQKNDERLCSEWAARRRWDFGRPNSASMRNKQVHPRPFPARERKSDIAIRGVWVKNAHSFNGERWYRHKPLVLRSRRRGLMERLLGLVAADKRARSKFTLMDPGTAHAAEFGPDRHCWSSLCTVRVGK